jgi:voltage-gated potassium channel
LPYSQLLVDSKKIRQSSWVRYLRAAWHDTNALLKEFRRPLLAIILSIFVGGWVYGELMVIAGMERLPYYDLPYIMLALMVFETPMDVPREWFLVAFWYVQPMVGIYIIGRGAVDFIRLFFNRSERRNAWELAVASTYRNHIILIGVGHVGLRVARTLYQMGFDIVAIDTSVAPDVDEELNTMNIPVIVGDARHSLTLRDGGLAHARSMIICTSNDHINLEITMRARDINPDIHIVTRMWDNRFAAQLKRFMNVEVLSASDLAAPAFAGEAVGIEITQTVKVNGQDFSMIRLRVQSGSFMEGKTIEFLQEDEDIDIVLHGKNGDDPKVHPDGDIVVKAEDTLVLFARHDKITDIVARNQSKRTVKQ